MAKAHQDDQSFRQHSDSGDEGDLVQPLVHHGPAEQEEAEDWSFSSRSRGAAFGAGMSSGGSFSNRTRSAATRHASLDAGQLQQRVFAANHVLDPRSSSSGQSLGGGADVAAAFKAGKARGSAGGANPNEGIEIAW